MTTTADPNSLRKRVGGTQDNNNNTNNTTSSPKNRTPKPAAAAPSSFSALDALRLLFGLLLLSTLSSYLLTNGESIIWNYPRPWWTKYKLVKSALGPHYTLTNPQLALYNGTDKDLPILLALNRTIYDVSASARVYGPGGFYSALAAKDASRSYITTCFDKENDLVPYMTGVEEVYVPLWLSKNVDDVELEKASLVGDGGGAGGENGKNEAEAMINSMGGMKTLISNLQRKIGKKQMRQLQEDAYAKAREKVRAQIRSWEGMFEMKGYPVVGKVVGVDDDDEEHPEKWENLELCENALRQREGMVESLGEAVKPLGLGGDGDGKIDLSRFKKGPERQEMIKEAMDKAKAERQGRE
ncbi:MAG: hypothetical protein M1831_001047 [Alyxoria varia]|nr:MAG: hypothetical protein M1831_001047 [Alyxoria varia]